MVVVILLWVVVLIGLAIVSPPVSTGAFFASFAIGLALFAVYHFIRFVIFIVPEIGHGLVAMVKALIATGWLAFFVLCYRITLAFAIMTFWTAVLPGAVFFALLSLYPHQGFDVILILVWIGYLIGLSKWVDPKAKRMAAQTHQSR